MTDTTAPLMKFVALFFIMIAAVQSFILYSAISTHPGMIVTNPYEKGLVYQDVIDKRNRLKEMGFNVRVVQENDAIVVDLADSDSESIASDRLSLHGFLSRPAGDEEAKVLSFIANSPTLFTADLHGVQRGLWQLEINLLAGSKHGLYQQNLFIK